MSSRVVHCKKEPYDVYIGRGSIWGNPFTHLKLSNTKAIYQVSSREESIQKYEEWIRNQPELTKRAKKELKGKILGCYCAPLSCHGDIIEKIANEE